MRSTIARNHQIPSHGKPAQKLLGLITRKERWGLSGRGWLLLALLSAASAALLVIHVHSFLAVTRRVDANTLVVEGWIQRYALRAALREFKTGRYEHVFTTGGPENGSGGYVNDYQTSASVGAEALKRLGLPGEAIQMAPSRVMGRERTYNSAVALRDWFRDHNLEIQSFNVLTEDCHARRTQLLFQEAFSKNVTIGVIAVSNPDYNPEDWWRYSDGVREVIGESIAYIYARFFFYPSPSPSDKKVAQAAPVSRQDR
jgi:uncharacterized SAM-binding protein YcdF (DUF218 family)